MASFRKRGRVWYYRFSDADGVKRERRGCPDRRATEEMARHAESMASRIREGTLEPEAMERAAARSRPIHEHLDEFIKALVVLRYIPTPILHACMISNAVRP